MDEANNREIQTAIPLNVVNELKDIDGEHSLEILKKTKNYLLEIKNIKI
ncbi:MAG: hypothetical protein ACXWFB_12750 [Nitrososphaeraceae archaeon]